MLYDALGRLAVRDVWESDHTESCYLYDGTRCVMEFGGTPPAQLYVYDDVGQLIFWQFGSDDLLPVQNVDNSLWLVFRRSALAAFAPTSATIKYQTLFEEQTWDPFGAGQILAYSGSPAPTVIGESRLHIGTGGRLYCAQEGL